MAAIVVSDAGVSLSGMGEESENYGTKQKHLNNLFGARLRITSMRMDAGAGFRKAVLVRDPDGHAMEIVEP